MSPEAEDLRLNKRELEELISFLTTIFGILIIGAVIALFVRLQRGLLGIFLSGIAVALLIFWVKEIKNFILKQPHVFNLSRDGACMRYDESWTYDLIDEDDETVLVAKVPGPEKEVKVDFSNRKLKINAGQGFKKVVSMPERIMINNITYKNGVLQVRLKK